MAGPMTTWAVVVAGGSGTRFGEPKQFSDLVGRPVLSWSLDVARRACEGVVLVVPAGHDRAWDADRIVVGGATRSVSVRAGLAAVPSVAAVIVVHDAARPLARLQLWHSVIEAVAAGADAAIPATPVSDTVKVVGPDGQLSTLDRSRLVAVQTPQAFRADVLRKAHAGSDESTDDAALVEALGGKVVLVDGPVDNIKVTTRSDLIVAEALMDVER
jgi:2-C-methyl-D-erythritol 4-phosphate cytidylyltransferase